MSSVATIKRESIGNEYPHSSDSFPALSPSPDSSSSLADCFDYQEPVQQVHRQQQQHRRQQQQQRRRMQQQRIENARRAESIDLDNEEEVTEMTDEAEVDADIVALRREFIRSKSGLSDEHSSVGEGDDEEEDDEIYYVEDRLRSSDQDVDVGEVEIDVGASVARRRGRPPNKNMPAKSAIAKPPISPTDERVTLEVNASPNSENREQQDEIRLREDSSSDESASNDVELVSLASEFSDSSQYSGSEDQSILVDPLELIEPKSTCIKHLVENFSIYSSKRSSRKKKAKSHVPIMVK